MISFQPKATFPGIISCLLLVLLPFVSNAYVFRVLGVSGKVKVKAGSQESILKAGAKLEMGQTIILEGGYCGLVHADGKILELKTPGSFPVEELAKKISGAGKAKVSERYVDYVMGQLSREETEKVEQNVRKYMDVPGSVHRGATSSRTGSDGIEITTARVFVFSSNEVQPSVYKLEWEAAEAVSSYTVSLKNRFEEVVLSKEVSENQTEIDFGKIATQVPDSYTLKVSYKGKKNGQEHGYLFKVNAAEDFGLDADDKSPAALMLNGILCEEKHYFLDALRYYSAASKLEQGVSTYSEAYEKLKLKMN
jgi:hypothetical protein